MDLRGQSIGWARAAVAVAALYALLVAAFVPAPVGLPSADPLASLCLHDGSDASGDAPAAPHLHRGCCTAALQATALPPPVADFAPVRWPPARLAFAPSRPEADRFRGPGRPSVPPRPEVHRSPDASPATDPSDEVFPCPLSHRGAPGAAALLCLSCLLPARAQEGAPPTALPEVAVAGAAGSLTVPSVEEQRRAVERDRRLGRLRRFARRREPLHEQPDGRAPRRAGRLRADALRPGDPAVDPGLRRSRAASIRAASRSCRTASRSTSPTGPATSTSSIRSRFRSVEVFKGGNALLFGASTLGGAVNAVSPTAYTATAPAFVRLEGGSFGAVRASVQASADPGRRRRAPQRHAVAPGRVPGAPEPGLRPGERQSRLPDRAGDRDAVLSRRSTTRARSCRARCRLSDALNFPDPGEPRRDHGQPGARRLGPADRQPDLVRARRRHARSSTPGSSTRTSTTRSSRSSTRTASTYGIAPHWTGTLRRRRPPQRPHGRRCATSAARTRPCNSSTSRASGARRPRGRARTRTTTRPSSTTASGSRPNSPSWRARSCSGRSATSTTCFVAPVRRREPRLRRLQPEDRAALPARADDPGLRRPRPLARRAGLLRPRAVQPRGPDLRAAGGPEGLDGRGRHARQRRPLPLGRDALPVGDPGRARSTSTPTRRSASRPRPSTPTGRGTRALELGGAVRPRARPLGPRRGRHAVDRPGLDAERLPLRPGPGVRRQPDRRDPARTCCARR